MISTNLQQKHTGLLEQITESLLVLCNVGPVTLHEPCFDVHEWLYHKACLDATFVLFNAEHVDQFKTDRIRSYLYLATRSDK